ncbi:MAG: MCE family protein [Planctomycetes bacterium]|nr:MCE family protein [Planctomycetota bacterium]MBI3844216.1 MCE family protein [Planctomycetota bacterium]
MSTRSERLKAGIFVTVCVAILVAIIVTLAGVKFFRRDREYHVLFTESVSGLDEGSQVSYKGVPIGRVREIRFAPNDVTRVEVLLAVRSDIVIPMDAKASIKSHGITGLNFIEISGGTNAAPSLEPGGRIEAEPSLIGTITDKFPQVVQNVDAVTRSMREFFDETNRDHIRSILDSLDRSLSATRNPVTEGAESFRRAAADIEASASKLSALVDKNEPDVRSAMSSLRHAAESADQIVSGDDMTSTIHDLRLAAARIREWTEKADGGAAITQFGSAASTARDVMARLDHLLDENQASISATLRSLRESSALLDEILRSLRDDPGLLLASPKAPEGTGPK